MEQPQPASSYSSSLPLEDRPLPAQLRKTINLGHVNVSQRGSKSPVSAAGEHLPAQPIPNLNSDAQAGQFNMPFVNSRRGSESPVDVGKGETGLSDVKSALTTAEAKIMEDSLADAGEVFNGHPTDDPPVRGNERHITSLAAANMEDSLNMDYLRNTGMNFALPECVWTVSVVLHRVRANCINFLQVLQRTIGNFFISDSTAGSDLQREDDMATQRQHMDAINNSEIFMDPSSMDFLANAGSKSGVHDSELARQSLYQNFDPFVGKAAPSVDQTHEPGAPARSAIMGSPAPGMRAPFRQAYPTQSHTATTDMIAAMQQKQSVIMRQQQHQSAAMDRLTHPGVGMDQVGLS